MLARYAPPPDPAFEARAVADVMPVPADADAPVACLARDGHEEGHP